MTACQGSGLLPARDVARFFGVSERLVRDRAAKGEWPSYSIGGRRVFDLDELVALVKRRQTRTDPPSAASPDAHEKQTQDPWPPDRKGLASTQQRENDPEEERK